ncbi:MAG: DNA repair protein RecO, partial [Acidimicrobiales bacterium]
AKGVRRTKSRFGARLEPLSHVSLLCWEGRELDVVTQVEVLDHFRTVREDLDRIAAAMVMLESVDQVSQEGQSDPRLYRMLVGALRTLQEGCHTLLVPAFLWRLLAQQGAAPVLDRCVRCGSEGPLVAFEPAEGGALCRPCRQGYPISADALALLAQILGGRLADALAVPGSPATAEVELLATRSMEAHLERRLRSVDVLDRG